MLCNYQTVVFLVSYEILQIHYQPLLRYCNGFMLRKLVMISQTIACLCFICSSLLINTNQTHTHKMHYKLSPPHQNKLISRMICCHQANPENPVCESNENRSIHVHTMKMIPICVLSTCSRFFSSIWLLSIVYGSYLLFCYLLF